MPMLARTGLQRLIAACAVACLITVASFSLALAHAVVTRSDPPDGAVVSRAPSEIRLWFSEAISPRATQAQVLDAQGRAISGAQAKADPRDPTLLVIAVPDLPQGVYNVVYSTLSAADGHATRGHLVFKVGAEGDSAPFGASQPGVVPWEAILRWLNYGTLAGLVGAIGVALLLFAPGRRSNGDGQEVANELARGRVRVLHWAIGCALAGMVIGLALLYMNAAILALPSADQGSTIGKALRLVFQTPAGALWIARQVLLCAILLQLYMWRRIGTRRWVGASAALLCLALLGIQALSGHAAAITSHKVLAVVVDTLHLAAASLWVGGLMALAIGVLPLALARRGTPTFDMLAQAAWGPFGALAALSVGVLIATGLYNTGQEVASVDGLLTTFYGRTLVVKVALVGLVGLVGLLNSAALHPRLSAPIARQLQRPNGWTPVSLRRLPLLIAGEVVLGLAVLLATGVLSSAPPANGPEFGPQVAPASSPALSRQVDDLLVSFEAKPNQPGDNVVLIRVANTRRPAPAPILRVIVHFIYQGQQAGTVSADAQPIASDTYQLSGSQLSLAGPWRVDVIVRRKGLEDTTASFGWVVSAGQPYRPVVYSNRPIGTLLTWAAVVVLAGVAVGIAALLRRPAALTHKKTGLQAVSSAN